MQRSIKTTQSQLNLILIVTPQFKWPINSQLHINSTSLVSPTFLFLSIFSESHNITHYTLIQRSRYDLCHYSYRYLHGYDSRSEVSPSISLSALVFLYRWVFSSLCIAERSHLRSRHIAIWYLEALTRFIFSLAKVLTGRSLATSDLFPLFGLSFYRPKTVESAQVPHLP